MEEWDDLIISMIGCWCPHRYKCTWTKISIHFYTQYCLHWIQKMVSLIISSWVARIPWSDDHRQILRWGNHSTESSMPSKSKDFTWLGSTHLIKVSWRSSHVSDQLDNIYCFQQKGDNAWPSITMYHVRLWSPAYINTWHIPPVVFMYLKVIKPGCLYWKLTCPSACNSQALGFYDLLDF